MTTYKPHIRVAAIGRLTDKPGTTDLDIWTCGVSVGLADGSPLGLGLLDNVVQAGAAFWGRIIAANGNILPQFPGHVKLDSIKATRIGVDGKSDGDPVSMPLGEGGAEVGDWQFPTQAALAVTLDTGADRAHPGRFYLPMPRTNQIDNNARVSGLAEATANRVAQCAHHFNDLLDAILPGLKMVVACGSTARGNLVANRPVLSIRVGDKIDTMESRRNASPEAYHTVEVATAPQPADS